MEIARIRSIAGRFGRAVRKHGFLWTLEKSIEFTRLRLERRHGSLAPSRQSLDPLLPRPRIYHSSPMLVDEIGVVPSVRPRNEDDYAFRIPFEAPVTHTVTRVAVIAHLFYVEYAEEIRGYIENIPVVADVFISTDTLQKKVELEAIFESYVGGSVEVRVTPNKGRDIGPKLVGFIDVYSRYEYFLHIHSKRSPHGGDGLKDWRRYLLDHLMGSADIVNSNLALLSSNSVGAVFAQHYFSIRGVLNWGYDFEFAKALLNQAGIGLTKENLLEFPSGSMFWGRSAAISKIIDLNLSFDDFEEEAGKIDGTLAHAMERSYLFFIEAAGYKWAKVSIGGKYPLPETQLPVETDVDIVWGLKRVYNSVFARPVTVYSPLERAIPTCRRIVAAPSDNTRPRINLIIPTVNPAQVFGGVATALKVFNALAASLGPGYDRRIVVTDASVVQDALALHADYALCQPGHDFDHEERILVDIESRAFPLALRRDDIFVASAWWNASQAHELQKSQLDFFAVKSPFVYLIQDFEPNFYGWSTQWAIAESTYRLSVDSFAIINSNELYGYMMAKYAFSNAFLLPYVPNKTIVDSFVSVARKKQILIYGRPSVARNCFELLLNGIGTWQSRNPVEAAQWEIVSVGEEYPEHYAMPVQKFSVRGKVDLAAYGKLLSESSVGISLMLSPHPSYPPLEMAQAGLITITNDFEGKDLSAYGDLIFNLKRFDPGALADAIESAVLLAGSGLQLPADVSPPLRVPPPCGRVVDYGDLAEALHNSCRQPPASAVPALS